MADAWGGSWGTPSSWGESWGAGASSTDTYGGAPSINLVALQKAMVRREDDAATKALEGLDFD